MKSISLYLGSIVIVIFMISCGGSSKPPRTDPATSEAFCNKVQASTESALTNDGIKSLIDDICKDTDSIKKALFDGSGTPGIKVVKESEESEDLSTVYYQGGLKLSDVSAKLYFNMMKDQAECKGDDCEVSEANGYEMDKSVTKYSPTVSGNSVKYTYQKDVTTGNEITQYEYQAIANFITIEEDSLYVVTNKLNKEGEVKKMFSVNIITGDTSSSMAFMGMTQTADNHGNHDSSISKSKKFFKEDAQRSYHNAQNYKKRNSK